MIKSFQFPEVLKADLWTNYCPGPETGSWTVSIRPAMSSSKKLTIHKISLKEAKC